LTDRDEKPALAGRRTSGPGRLLVAVYALFALAAGSRAAVQIATKFHQAPLAYLLSGLAAIVYLVATVALARDGDRWRWIAVLTCSFELVGVLAIGTFSRFDSADFPDATVWSVYGRGYGFIPLVLPMIGLYWLRRTGPATTSRAQQGLDRAALVHRQVRLSHLFHGQLEVEDSPRVEFSRKDVDQ
jgi:hypothetical protein